MPHSKKQALPKGWKVKKAPTQAGGWNYDIFHNKKHIGIAFEREMGVTIACSLEANHALESPSPKDIAEIQRDLDMVPKCEGCIELGNCDGDCIFVTSKEQRETLLFHLSQQENLSIETIDPYEERCPCGGKLEHKAEWLIPWLHEKHVELQCDRCTCHYIHARPLPGNIFLKPCYSCDKSLKGDFRGKGEYCPNWRFCKEYRRWKEDNEYQVPPR